MALIDTTTYQCAHPISEAAVDQEVFELPARGASVAEARRHVRTWLSERAASEDDCDTATLVISELFTNAVIHTDSGAITCAIWSEAGGLHLEVTDQGVSTPEPQVRRAGVDDENGRGLLLVESLADHWGVDSVENGQGRVVWATLHARV